MRDKKPTTLSEWAEYFSEIDRIELEKTCKENNELYKKYFPTK